jgi:hypothetical protein
MKKYILVTLVMMFGGFSSAQISIFSSQETWDSLAIEMEKDLNQRTRADGRVVNRNISENRRIFSYGKKFGYEDQYGNIVIPALYDYVNDFTDGIAIVSTEERSWHIDKKGNPLYVEKYQHVGEFTNGYAVVLQQERMSVEPASFHIRKDGTTLYDKKLYDECWDFNQYGRAAVRKWIKRGGNYVEIRLAVVDTFGKELISMIVPIDDLKAKTNDLFDGYEIELDLLRPWLFPRVSEIPTTPPVALGTENQIYMGTHGFGYKAVTASLEDLGIKNLETSSVQDLIDRVEQLGYRAVSREAIVQIIKLEQKEKAFFLSSPLNIDEESIPCMLSVDKNGDIYKSEVIMRQDTPLGFLCDKDTRWIFLKEIPSPNISEVRRRM